MCLEDYLSSSKNIPEISNNDHMTESYYDPAVSSLRPDKRKDDYYQLFL